MALRNFLTTTFIPTNNTDLHDNKWKGDEIGTCKNEHTTRMMFHNIRHLPLYGAMGLEQFIHAQSTLKIDLQAFSEHSLDTTKFQVYQSARHILRATHPHPALIQLDSSAERAINQYKPGGTGILVLGTLASKLETQGKGGDTLGRWSFTSFRRRHFPPVTVISVYQVCPRPTNRIGNTAFHQQTRLLQQTGRNIHPRRAFVEDLQAFVSSLRTKGHDIILGGDFNESLQDKNSGVFQIATSLNLVDPFLHKFPQHQEFGTHETGRRRIDLVLVTPAILPCITALGYAPFDYASTSDHRPLLLDLNTALLFGTTVHDTTQTTKRILRSTDKIAVQTFIHTLYDRLQHHQAFAAQKPLDDNLLTPEEVERLDSLLGDCSEIAEKQCRPRRREYYSRQIVRQRLEVSILRRHLKALQKCQNRTPQLHQHMQRTGIVIDLPPTQTLTRKALQHACSRLQETSRASFETRQAELVQKIQDLSNQSKRTPQKILNAIRKVEQQRRTFHTLKAMKRSTEGSSTLDRLDIPQSWPSTHQPTTLDDLEDPKRCTEWKTVTEPAEIEHYLLLRNRLHFGQAQGTPFTIDPLQSELDWLATSPAAEALLQGKYHYPGDHPQLQRLLAACKAAAPLDSIPQELSMGEFRSKIRSWKESTTTSPSGRHLGRYKAIFVPMLINTERDSLDQSLSFADKQELIAKLVLSLINYCIRNTYVLTRWKTVINVMILKEPGDYRIRRLRVIHLYEADYNAMCAIKWRRLLHFADSH